LTADGPTNVNAETTDSNAERGVGDEEARNGATRGNAEPKNRNTVGGQLADEIQNMLLSIFSKPSQGGTGVPKNTNLKCIYGQLLDLGKQRHPPTELNGIPMKTNIQFMEEQYNLLEFIVQKRYRFFGKRYPG